MSDQEEAKTTGEHQLVEVLREFIEVTKAGTKQQRRVVLVLFASGFAMLCTGALGGYSMHRQQVRQEEFASKLEAIAEQVSTVQRTADATQTSVAVIEDRPVVDLEIVDAPASATSGPAQPTALIVVRKPPKPSASARPSVSFTIPVPLTSAPTSATEPEKKK